MSKALIKTIAQILHYRGYLREVFDKTFDDYLNEEYDDLNISEDDFLYYKTRELEEALSWKSIDCGYFKCVFEIDSNMCLKIDMRDAECNNGYFATINEVILYKFIKEMHPELLPVLTPIYAYGDGFTICKKLGQWTDKYHFKVYDLVIRLVKESFRRIGILIHDITGRVDNLGVDSKTIRILDYDSWTLLENISEQDYIALRRIVWKVTGEKPSDDLVGWCEKVWERKRSV